MGEETVRLIYTSFPNQSLQFLFPTPNLQSLTSNLSNSPILPFFRFRRILPKSNEAVMLIPQYKFLVDKKESNVRSNKSN